jgi:integrase
MSVTIKLVLRESKTRSDGTAPIYLRVTANRKSRYKSTGIRLKPRHWNSDRQSVRKSHELHAAYNDKLRSIRIEAEEVALSADTAEAVKAKIEGSGGTMTTFFEQFIEGLNRRDQFWEKRKYSTTLNKLQDTFGRDEIDWSDLDRDTLERFETYCREERENNPNTTRKELSRLRRVTRQAIRDRVIGVEDNPFIAYDMPKRIPPDRRRLSRKEIRALEVVGVEGELALARDAFLLSFFGGGIRFGDVCRLRPEHATGGRLRYRMMKTDQPVDLPLPPPAQAIIGRRTGGGGPFIFPFLDEGDDEDPVRLRRRISSCNVVVNRNIKKVGKQAEIKKPDDITFHVARHSFADFARRKSSDLYAVSKALGHSSLKITENYLSDFDREATDRLVDEMWGGDGDE